MLIKDLWELAEIIGGHVDNPRYSGPVEHIQTDTRLTFRPSTVFIALKGPHYDGSAFLVEARKAGARAAVVSESFRGDVTGLDLVRVFEPLRALQALAAHHHRSLKIPTVAVTGSNGKTILKDFLTAILNKDRFTMASPGSYNSQVGVALSLLRLRSEARLAVIEAGISREGEMDALADMIRPDFGILTNIGMAHFEGFGSQRGIASEKMKLFRHLGPKGWLLLPDDPNLDMEAVRQLPCPHYLRGKDAALPRITHVRAEAEGVSVCTVRFPDDATHYLTLGIDASFRQVFATIETGLCAAWLLGISPGVMIEAGSHFSLPQNRIEIWKSPVGSVLANDTYSSDPVSARSCLAVFDHYPGKRKIFVFGGMKELGAKSAYEHRIVGEAAARRQVDLFLTVGELPKPAVTIFKERRPGAQVKNFPGVAALTDYVADAAGENDVIVVKGPRELKMDQVAIRFKARLTQTVYYINLSRIHHNLMVFRGLIPRETRVMVMLKAFAYGTDAGHVARFLQNHVDYFGVAYTKEAVALRRGGVTSNLLVQLVGMGDVEEVAALSLQPVVFDIETARALSRAAVAADRHVKVHLKVDTGMGRFGVFVEDLAELAGSVQKLDNLEIEGLMTHFSSADDPAGDPFTNRQIELFIKAREILAQMGIHPPLVHASATAGAVRHPSAHFSMIRLGLGMYGIYPSEAVAREIELQCPVALVSRIGSLKKYPKGYPVSYNRRFTTKRESTIAFIPMGYHDGLSRALSNKGYVLVHGKKAPIVGAVCMDFTPVDVTGIPDVAVGDPVLIFGEWQGWSVRVEELAKMEGTIPYEVLCRLSDRIQRIYLLDEE
ncbi:MAG: alanine racemase [Acidobacteriota bacterium]|nr:alanine racemase [Acidobacteriota bacterium]